MLLLVPAHLMNNPLSSADHDWIAANGGKEVTRVLSLSYDKFSRHAVLKAILPSTVTDVPSAFEMVGHIAHYNLKEDHLPYRHIIGEHAACHVRTSMYMCRSGDSGQGGSAYSCQQD